IQRAPANRMTVVATDTTTRLQYSHRRRRGRPPTTSTTGSLLRLSLMQPSLRRRDLNRAAASAAATVGPVHVLHISLGMNVPAGRHGAHHRGDGEAQPVAARAFDRGAEAVVTELGVHWLLRILDPGQRAGIARGDEPRIVDLEACRQIIGDEDASELRR